MAHAPVSSGRTHRPRPGRGMLRVGGRVAGAIALAAVVMLVGLAMGRAVLVLAPATRTAAEAAWVLAVCAVLASALKVWLDKGLQQIAVAMPEAPAVALERHLVRSNPDELQWLTARAAAVAEQLSSITEVGDVARRYVGQRVLDDLLEGSARPVEGEDRVVTVVFTDLAGYSSLSERATPSVMLALLNDVLGRCTEAVESCGGCVIDFYGDAMLAVFGAPRASADHAQQALAAIAAVEDAVDALNLRWRDDPRVPWVVAGVERLTVRAGVHTGRVLLADVGSRSRLKYTAVGDAVNVASRLEQLNKVMGTRVLVTAEVLGAAGGAPAVDDLGWVQVRGRDQPVHIYGLLAQEALTEDAPSTSKPAFHLPQGAARNAPLESPHELRQDSL